MVIGYLGVFGNKKSPHFEQSVAIELFGWDDYLPNPPLWWGTLGPTSSFSQDAIDTVVPRRTAASRKSFKYLFMTLFVLEVNIQIFLCCSAVVMTATVQFILLSRKRCK